MRPVRETVLESLENRLTEELKKKDTEQSHITQTELVSLLGTRMNYKCMITSGIFATYKNDSARKSTKIN
jgi:aspartokinase